MNTPTQAPTAPAKYKPVETPSTPLLMIGTVGTLTVKDGCAYITWPDRAGLPDGQYPLYAGAANQ